MQLVIYPNNPLFMPATVDGSGYNEKEKRAIESEMFQIMASKEGVGLAATQVGLNLRMFVWKQDGFQFAVWNPILRKLDGRVESTEGCLSLPGVTVTLQRAISSQLAGFTKSGKLIKMNGNISVTRIWQHEIDHLDGKLIIDHMSREDTLKNRGVLRTLLRDSVTDKG